MMLESVWEPLSGVGGVQVATGSIFVTRDSAPSVVAVES